MELFECSECLKLSRESQIDRPLVGESASPFIGEGDGLTREKERGCARMILSLVTHAVGYKTVVGAHNTVYVRRVCQALPCSLGMAKDGAHNTVRQMSAPITLFGF